MNIKLKVEHSWIIINEYKIESGTLMDTLRFVWRALLAQIPMCWQRMGRCASKHNWPITIYLTAGAWFMNCWLLVGRRWRNRQQRPLVLDMCKCHTKSQWVTVTLTDSSVYATCWYVIMKWCTPETASPEYSLWRHWFTSCCVEVTLRSDFLGCLSWSGRRGVLYS